MEKLRLGIHRGKVNEMGEGLEMRVQEEEFRKKWILGDGVESVAEEVLRQRGNGDPAGF